MLDRLSLSWSRLDRYGYGGMQGGSVGTAVEKLSPMDELSPILAIELSPDVVRGAFTSEPRHALQGVLGTSGSIMV